MSTVAPLVVRRTFLEVDREVTCGRPRAETDSCVDYSVYDMSLSAKRDTEDLSTAPGSSPAESDAASVSSWADEPEPCDAPASPVQAPLSGPPGCHLASPASPVFVMMAMPSVQAASATPATPATPNPAASGFQPRNRRLQGRTETKQTSRRKDVTQKTVSASCIILRHLPSELGSTQVRTMLDSDGFAGLYDFLYVPADFATSKSLGYAIVNFISSEHAAAAKESWHGARMGRANLEVEFSKTHSGLASLVQRYQGSRVLTDKSVSEENKPLLFQNGKASHFSTSA